MPSGTEMDILNFIDMKGGETKMGAIKRLLSSYGSSYVETVCGSLGRRDFLDWFANGTVKLTDKGRKAVGKTSPGEEMVTAWMERPKERPKETPEEKYRRWIARR